MERDDEVKSKRNIGGGIIIGKGNSYTTHYRSYDPRTTRWWSLDPKPTASESWYVGLGNNPILNTDVLGDIFDISNNEGTFNEVKSLPKTENVGYVTNDNGRIGLDFGDMDINKRQEIIDNDQGLSLINDLVTSPKKFLYEASDYALYKNEDGEKETAIMAFDNTRIINASNGGFDSNDKHSHRPKDNYDGQVIIHPLASYTEKHISGATIDKPRASMVFHELSENFERTHHLNNYNGPEGAHEKARGRERLWHGRSCQPGFGVPKPTEKPSEARMEEIINIFRQYRGW